MPTTDETSPEEWFTWRTRDHFQKRMRETTCPREVVRAINCMRTIEALYPRGEDYMTQEGTVRTLEDMGEPDHPLGYRWSTIETKLGEERMGGFTKWMRGQTVAVDDHAEPPEAVVYPWDLRRWLENPNAYALD